LNGESKAQKKVMSIHVLDGMFLAGQDIRDLHLTERMRRIKIFLKVMNKPSQHELVRLRPKNMFKLEDIVTDDSVWQHLSEKSIKGRPGICQVFTNPEPDPDGSQKFFPVKGIYLYRHVKDPYIIGYSKSTKMKYFFNTMTRSACEYNTTPTDGIANFNWSHRRRLVWNFTNPYQDSGRGIERDDFLQFINSRR
jgi:cap1 methyltransferase